MKLLQNVIILSIVTGCHIAFAYAVMPDKTPDIPQPKIPKISMINIKKVKENLPQSVKSPISKPVTKPVHKAVPKTVSNSARIAPPKKVTPVVKPTNIIYKKNTYAAKDNNISTSHNSNKSFNNIQTANTANKGVNNNSNQNDSNKIISAHTADYLNNPPPSYPQIARRRRLEGTVYVKVFVSSAGKTISSVINKSSGHDILDQAAIDTIARWRFVPASQNGKNINSYVTVPITFKLI